MEKDFDAILDKAEDLLWPENMEEARWSDIYDRYAEQAGMSWLPPKGLENLKLIACNRGRWEDLGNGYISKSPKKKRTSAQIIAAPELGDEGRVRLTVNAQNAGPSPRVYYAEDKPVTETSKHLKDNSLTTTALRVNFLVRDLTDQYETGEVVTWTNRLVLETNSKRLVTNAVSNSMWLPAVRFVMLRTAASPVKVKCTSLP